ncbi:MATE family efflux transporter [Anaerosphaera multitolerans]|uniref:MATE family efflux transporter n=1 Tax=Anaerosphaera multitolerans TaxID=2487351 RepID=A0A437S9C7_9FIRM|nr:MATE family efflux transporter [Anaerosphaera multitolerans]RVU55725.1 MATE family efflux transporter [Anaerosphaera multitolerans]
MRRKKLKLNEKRNINLTEGSIARGIIYFAIPLLLSNFLQQLYNTADLMIVGKFAGKNPMAAVGATGPISNLLIGLFVGLTTGAAVVVSQKFGSGDRKKLNNAIHTAYAISIVGGILLSFLGYLISPMLLRMLNTPAEIMEDSISYMRIFFIGVIPLLIYNMGASILRSVGDSKRPFNFLCVGAVTNIVLDLIFVKNLNMSVRGAGWATFASQMVTAILVTYSLMKSENIFRLKLKEVKFYKDSMREIFSIGIPSGIQGSVISLSNVLIQTKINGFGSDAIAGLAAEGRIDGFIFMALQAIALAATTFAGQNFGAKKYERIKSGMKVSMALVIGSAIILSTIAVIFARQLIGIFNSAPDVIDYGAKCIYYLAGGYFIFGMSEIYGGFIRASGKAVPPMVISIISMCGLRIIWIYTALVAWNRIEIIYLSYPISWTVTCILMALYYYFGKWRPTIEETAKV